MELKAGAKAWLFKSDPDSFGFEDLLAAPGKRTLWDGVRNYQARNFLRDGVRPGDGVLFYHSSSTPPAIVGLAEVVRAAQPDESAFDPKDEHYDPKSKRETPTWYAVEIRAVRALPRPLTLAELKQAPALAGLALLQRGQRLSIQPVSRPHWAKLLSLAGIRS